MLAWNVLDPRESSPRARALELFAICEFDDKIGVNFSARAASKYAESRIENILPRDFFPRALLPHLCANRIHKFLGIFRYQFL